MSAMSNDDTGIAPPFSPIRPWLSSHADMLDMQKLDPTNPASLKS